MYLTRMELDTEKRNTMKAMISPNLFHGAVEAAFPGKRTRKLWRIDKIRNHCYMLLLSDREPLLDQAVKQFGIKGSMWETKNYDSLLDHIEQGTKWQFRLTANPTRCVKNETGKRGVVRAHNTPYFQKKWLMDRCKKWGFSVAEEDFVIREARWQKFYKGEIRNYPITILSVTFEGILTISDSEIFKKTLTEGVGRGKAYGMGLLTVIKVRGENG